jgi:hypothetical protein
MAKNEMHSEKSEMKKDLAQDKKMIKSAMAKHEKAKHPGQPLTKLRAGGVTSKSMMQMGRNLARVANQRSTGRGG